MKSFRINKSIVHVALIVACCSALYLLSSCLKAKTFPPIPSIEYSGFEILGDSAKLTITFTDGDGDIGLSQDIIAPPYDTGSYYYYNLYVHYYELMNGAWVHGTGDPSGNNSPLADSIILGYRIKNLTPIGQNKALKGAIEVTLEPSFFNTNPNALNSDSIRYEIILIDRALNKSNILVTPTIVR